MNAEQLKQWRDENAGINPSLIGQKHPTDFGGLALITAYDAKREVYTTGSGCLWAMQNELLVSYYDTD